MVSGKENERCTVLGLPDIISPEDWCVIAFHSDCHSIIRRRRRRSGRRRKIEEEIEKA